MVQVWSVAQPLVHGATVTSSQRPAVCEFNGRAFVAWPTQSDDDPNKAGPSFSFTCRNLADDDWAEPKLVPFKDRSMYQSHVSAMVAWKGILYAFIPYMSKSDNGSGLAIYSYDGATFQYAGKWGTTWCTDVAAVVSNGILHVIGHPNNLLKWTYSTSKLNDITGPGGFSDNTDIKGALTSSDVALLVRDDKVVAHYLNLFGGRVMEFVLTMGSKPEWKFNNDLEQSGRSGVSSVSLPDGQEWLCFKKHGGDSNLICHYKKDGDCWSSNYSMGDSNPWSCLNEAALVWANGYVYAVWNTWLPGNPLYFSRTLMPQSSSDVARQNQRVYGAGYIPDQPSATDRVVDMKKMGDMTKAQAQEHSISEPLWVLDQGAIGSCTANAVATAYRYELKRQRKQDFMVSRLYLYYVARLARQNAITDTASFYNSLAKNPPVTQVTANTGTNIREAVKILSCLGAVSEDGWTYTYQLATQPRNDPPFLTNNNGSFPPQNGCFAAARKRYTLNYSLAELSVQCWKGCIGNNYPVVFGFSIYESFDKFIGACKGGKAADKDVIAPIPFAQTETYDKGGHAVIAVGWNDNVPNQTGGTTGCFLVQNSWGKNWGKNGFFWMPYQWLTMKDPKTNDDVINKNFLLTLMGSYDN